MQTEMEIGKFLRTIAEKTGGGLASRGERAEKSALQTRHDNAKRVMLAHTDQAAKQAFLAHQKELQAAIGRGDLHKMDGYGLDEFKIEFVEKMQAAKAEMHAVTMEAAPLVEKISERFAKAAEKYAADQAKAEADAYSEFGLPYPGESYLVKMLKSAAAIARARVPRGEYSNMSPNDCLPYID